MLFDFFNRQWFASNIVADEVPVIKRTIMAEVPFREETFPASIPWDGSESVESAAYE